MNMNEQCPNCGEWMSGDGYTVVRHCPNAEVPMDVAPDERVIYCDPEDDAARNE